MAEPGRQIISEEKQLEMYHKCIENNQSPALCAPFSVSVRFSPSRSPTLAGVLLAPHPVECVRVFTEEDLLELLRMILQTFW
jgi:hypothetical protein